MASQIAIASAQACVSLSNPVLPLFIHRVHPTQVRRDAVHAALKRIDHQLSQKNFIDSKKVFGTDCLNRQQSKGAFVQDPRTSAAQIKFMETCKHRFSRVRKSWPGNDQSIRHELEVGGMLS